MAGTERTSGPGGLAGVTRAGVTRAARAREVRAEGLRLGYDGRTVVPGIELRIPTGRVTAIVGANGCGKSTLLRGLARLLRPEAGRVLIDETDVHGLAGRQLARMLGILPQQPVAPEGITVAELVSRGRHPHQAWFAGRSGRDDEIIAAAMERTGCAQLAGRPVEELSGGQRQRVWIAMALAQDPDVLLLDEPTTFLDVAHQLDVLDLLTELNRHVGTTVVMVLHDLNLAARYADHLVMMRAGEVLAEGAPDAVLTAETVAEAFGLRARIVPDPVCGSPMVVPIGRFHGADAEDGSVVTDLSTVIPA